MHHYDDLQRFKDKTRTSTLNLRDLSTQNRIREQGNWSIVNQMTADPDAAPLARGGNVTQPVPQPVDPQNFVLNDLPAPVAAPEPVASVAPTILQTLAVPPVPVIEPVPAPRPEPVAAPVAPTNFSRLFAAPPTETSRTVEKNQPLQSLLERIATCR